MLGKKKCKILREIRQQIASENDIPFVTEECRYQGDCKGTCPKCESELRYLEAQMEKRRSLGKAVTVSAVALGLMTGMAGCGRQVEGDLQVLEGEVPYIEETTDADATEPPEELAGMIAPETEPEEFELEGDVAYVPETEETEIAPLAGSIIYPTEDAETTADAADAQN
jgi:hypothetical protein